MQPAVLCISVSIDQGHLYWGLLKQHYITLCFQNITWGSQNHFQRNKNTMDTGSIIEFHSPYA